MKNKKIVLAILAVIMVAVAVTVAVFLGKSAETLYPEEAGYYVVWDDFTMMNTNDSSIDPVYSSWDVFSPTTKVTRDAGACFTDNSEFSSSQMQRVFNPVSEDFTWEFTVMADKNQNGTFLELRNADIAAIRIELNGENLELVTANGNQVIGAYPSRRFVLLKLYVSPQNGTYTISVDGKQVNGTFDFLNPCTQVDRLFIETSEEGKGRVILSTVRIYVDYYVNEKFLNGDQGTVSDEWVQTGGVTVAKKTGTQAPDHYSALMKNGATLSRNVSYAQDGAWFEYQLLIPETMDEFSVTLEDDSGNTFRITTKEHKFGYYDKENMFVELYSCVPNVWYHIMLKQTDDGNELYLNHKLKDVVELPFKGKFTKIVFTAGMGEAFLDDIVLKDWIPLPDDYVSEPTQIVKSEENKDILVGLQSCNLWVEGTHFGYDWLTDWAERRPYLGYYDELLPEVADWELKWKIEHGIDYELYCWYRPQSSAGEPIKMCRNAAALHEGYFNAQYSNMMKFAITWEASSGPAVKDSEDFRNNIVPYWIEQYFKDERYLLVDNKPVLGMYNVNQLIQYFGSEDALKAELDYLRQACVEAGFDGCYIMMSSSANNAAKVETCGFDAQYTYSWGDGCHAISLQKDGMIAFNEAIQAAGGNSSIIPTVSMGWSNYAWGKEAVGGYTTPEDYASLLQWTRDEFMPTLDQDDLGARMILLDNWNEYGEGHFLIPSELHGFGYVDAIRSVLGDGDTEHTDVKPTENQLSRINHMYVQDRYVPKIDKSKFEGASGYQAVATFNYNGKDTEDWNETPADGTKYSHALSVLKTENGSLYGKTADPKEGEVVDPAISSGAISLDANQVTRIRLRIRVSKEVTESRFYFITDTDSQWNQAKSVGVKYIQTDAGEDGFTELVFMMDNNANWRGTVTQIRLDPMNGDGEFWIDSIELMEQAPLGEYDLSFGGALVRPAAPYLYEQDTFLMPITELSKLADGVRWSQSLDGATVAIYISSDLGDFLFTLPYGKNEMTVNGQQIALVQGARKVDDVVYIPLVPVLDMLGDYVCSYDLTAKTMNVRTSAMDPNYEVVRRLDFVGGNSGWGYGGETKISNVDGNMQIKPGDGRPRIYVHSAPLRPLGYQQGDVTHVRIRLKIEVPKGVNVDMNTTMMVGPLFEDETWYGINRTTPYTFENGKYVYVLVDISDVWSDENALLNAIYILPWGSSNENPLFDAGATITINSVEFLKYVGP